jgi:GNAT superfamily N-acetyltransferase
MVITARRYDRPMETVPFEPALDDSAAALVARRVAAARRTNPLIPVAWAEAEPYLRELEALHRRGSGIAMLHGGRMVGFMAAFEVRRGETWTYTPEWAWAAEAMPGGLSRQVVIQELYASAAAGWVEADLRAHFVAVLAGDRTSRRALRWVGFGHSTMDGLRDLGPIAPTPGVVVRRAVRADAPMLAELEDGLRAHLVASPVFLALGPARTLTDQRKRIGNSEAAVLLAEVNGQVVGHMIVGPSSDDAATIIRDAATASISGAFVRPEHRRTGVADTLLAAAIEWARSGGYERMAVDFETANLLASRFWTRSFRPVTITLARRV